jgi:hypothetical protein
MGAYNTGGVHAQFIRLHGVHLQIDHMGFVLFEVANQRLRFKVARGKL